MGHLGLVITTEARRGKQRKQGYQKLGWVRGRPLVRQRGKKSVQTSCPGPGEEQEEVELGWECRGTKPKTVVQPGGAFLVLGCTGPNSRV